MPAIKFHPTSSEETSKPPDSPATMSREPKPRVQIEWVRHSKFACLAYLLTATVLTSYYSACFLTQYGTINAQNDARFNPMPILDEPTLTRVIMVQWLMLASVLVTGLLVFRRIFMPLYIFLAVMATNGTLVLFVVKMKQFSDGKIGPDDLSLNLVGVLLVTATAHNLVYLYAMHLHLNRSYNYLLQTAEHTLPAAIEPEVVEEKKTIDSFV